MAASVTEMRLKNLLLLDNNHKLNMAGNPIILGESKYVSQNIIPLL
jgi:hypothetical protein